MMALTFGSNKRRNSENIIAIRITLVILLISINIISCSAVGGENLGIAAAQKNLLSLFGMKKRPAFVDRKKAVIPKAMLDLYRKQLQSEVESPVLPLIGRHSGSANTARSYSHMETEVDTKFPHNHKFRLRYNTSNVPESEHLTAAELKITLVPKDTILNKEYNNQRIFVHDIVLPGKKGISKPILRLVDTKEIDVEEKVINLDVLPAVERWLSDPQGNYGLLIEVTHHDGSKPEFSHVRLRRSLDEPRGKKENWDDVQPLLFLYTDDKRNTKNPHWSNIQRKKRTSSPQESTDKKKSKRKGKDICQRHPLYVDFERVGWNDWIVAPPGYEAYHCAGDCPFPLADHLNSTNHAIVQTLMHSMHPLQIPKACCVPTALAPISMLYLDEESKVVLKNYQDMSVVGCGCR